jgi:predicted RNA-binding protein with RPS1 domain
VHVSTVGLHAAREQLSEQEKRLPSEIGMALLLARRALFPVKTWTQGDPVSLGLAEYQQEIHEERLRGRLLDAKSAALHKLSREGVGMARVVLATGGRPNPLVQSLDDIRPGMTLNAIITSIAPFGAFANIGLPEEGLIHLSELSDEYVKDAASVVRVGQEVRARVLAVERDRRRIQLSIKTGEKQNSQRRGKNIALSNLDALFSGKKSS